MIHVEKFPELTFNGRRLVWDSRQVAGRGPEWVFIPARHAAPEILRTLAARADARFVLAAADDSPLAQGLRARGAYLDVEDPRVELGQWASASLGDPSRRLCVLAVTGTNGKTTSVQLLRRVLTFAGHTVAELGTLGLSVYGPRAESPRLTIETGFTTPDAPTLHHLLAQLLASGVTHVAMEASSHAMELGRIAGVDFDGAVFTNLSRDHLDFHGTMERYADAKARLFTEYLPRSDSRKTKWAVVNAAGDEGRRLLAALPLSVRATAFIEGKTFRIESDSLSGLRLSLGVDEILSSPMVGAFNAENIVGVTELARSLGVDFETIRESLRAFVGPPGRMERVSSLDGRHVFVDYAHTPDALEKSLRVLRDAQTNGASLTVVFGCGGDRDRTKRPLMGKIATQYADRVVITTDNPRSEDAKKIMQEIIAGISAQPKVICIEDRATAIRDALAGLRPNDACLIAGKGHENFQIIGTKKIPFSDAALCREVLSAPH